MTRSVRTEEVMWRGVVRDTLVILIISLVLGFGLSWFLDYAAWEHDVVQLGEPSLYAIQAIESWVVGMSAGTILAIALVYGFLAVRIGRREPRSPNDGKEV